MTTMTDRFWIGVGSLFLIISTAQAQDCAKSASCNTVIAGVLDFTAGVCLDSSTRRYQLYRFNGVDGQPVTIEAQSAFFAPAVAILDPLNIQVATDSNADLGATARVSYTLTSTGTWTAVVRNIEVGDGGPFSLRIQCGSPAPPGPTEDGFELFSFPSVINVGAEGGIVFSSIASTVKNFNSPVVLSVGATPSGITASLSANIFPAPGQGSATLTIGVAPNMPLGNYRIVVTGKGGILTREVGVTIAVAPPPCESPIILGQTPSHNVTKGRSAVLSVTHTGTSPIAYQWFLGPSGSEFFPVADATSQVYVTPPLMSDAHFWVRVRNGCGVRSSATISVTVVPAKRSRAAQRGD